MPGAIIHGQCRQIFESKTAILTRVFTFLAALVQLVLAFTKPVRMSGTIIRGQTHGR
jgi:cytochrome c oxidase assembly factor CtaG